MRKETKDVYFCDWCKKHSFTVTGIKNHERCCKKNPANDRACFGCSHLKKCQGVGRAYLFCTFKSVGVYPPKVERNNHIKPVDLGRCGNVPMPKECKDFRK